MSMSLRDQLLQAGLINKKQASDAEREQQRRERQPPSKNRRAPDSQPARPAREVQPEKIARDQQLNRQRNEKALKKARLAELKQLIEQNRLALPENGEDYNFLDGTKIRRLTIEPSMRERLTRGNLVVVRHAGGYDVVPAAVAQRIRERDAQLIVPTEPEKPGAAVDDAYAQFKVPDDLIW